MGVCSPDSAGSLVQNGRLLHSEMGALYGKVNSQLLRSGGLETQPGSSRSDLV